MENPPICPIVDDVRPHSSGRAISRAQDRDSVVPRRNGANCSSALLRSSHRNLSDDSYRGAGHPDAVDHRCARNNNR